MGLHWEGSAAGDACRFFRVGVRVGRAVVESHYAGLYRSKLYGVGVEYVDFRDYSYGDDVRFVDWRLSARMVSADGGLRLVVKVFQAERAREVLLLADLTASMGFNSKPWVLGFALTVLAMVAAVLEDRVRLVLLSDRLQLYTPRAPMDVVALVSRLVCREGYPRGSLDIAGAERLLLQWAPRPIILATDYAHSIPRFSTLLARVRRAGAPVLVLVVSDPYELHPPGDGVVEVCDVELPRHCMGVRLSDYYQAVQRHVRLFRAAVKAHAARLVELVGPSGARGSVHRLVEGYLRVRSGR